MRRKYNGKPFPPLVFAFMEDDGDGGEMTQYDDSPIQDVAGDYPKWIAKYKLVSVRRLRRKVTVRAVEAK